MSHLVNFLAEYGLYLGIPLVFLLIVAWIYRPSAKKRYEADGNLPFYGDKK
jgi:cbb3-type cytochrome oxidase subunit 3